MSICSHIDICYWRWFQHDFKILTYFLSLFYCRTLSEIFVLGLNCYYMLSHSLLYFPTDFNFWIRILFIFPGFLQYPLFNFWYSSSCFCILLSSLEFQISLFISPRFQKFFFHSFSISFYAIFVLWFSLFFAFTFVYIFFLFLVDSFSRFSS